MLSSSVVVSSSVVNATVVAAAVVTAAVVAAVVTAVVEAVVEAVGAAAEFIETWLGTDILFMFPIFPMDIPLGDITCTGPPGVNINQDIFRIRNSTGFTAYHGLLQQAAIR